MDKRCMIINEAREMYFINQIDLKLINSMLQSIKFNVDLKF